MPPHAKFEYKAQYGKDFAGIKKGQDKHHAFCIPCKDDINLTSMGKAAIRVHQAKTKHKANAKASATTHILANFMPSRSASTAADDKTAAAEGTWSYHIARHNQSFLSADCVSSGLFRTMFPDSEVAKKFGSSQDKTAKILTGSLLPPMEYKFVFLDMKSLPGEDSQLVATFIASVLQENGLLFKNLVSFCADNAPVNFGGPKHQGPNNIFKKLKENKKNLIPIGCPAHILHNAAQKAAERLTFDIESIIFKLSSYFKGSTRCHEQLKDFCEYLEVNYETIPNHGPTRWLTLKKVVDKMLKLWDPLLALFTSIDKPPRMLEDFFKSEESVIVLHLLQSVHTVFERPLLLLQKSTALLPELLTFIEIFKSQISDRRRREFYGAATATSLRLSTKALTLKRNFDEFYTTVIDYIDKWFRLEALPTSISWIMLANNETDYNEVLQLAKQVAPELAEMDALFNKVSELNHLVQKIPAEVFDVDSAEEKWKKIFKGNDSLPCLYLLVSKILSIPVANAFIERVFSLCGAQWTKERNLLRVGTVKSPLQVRVNYDLSCNEMFNLLLKTNSLLKKDSWW